MPDFTCFTISRAPAVSAFAAGLRRGAAFFFAALVRAAGLAALVLLGTRSLLALPGTVAHFALLHAPRLRDVAHGAELLDPIDCRPHHVVRVGRSQRLGQDVGHAGAIEHRAHRTAGDDAGTTGGGLQQHPARAMLAHDLVRDSGAFARYVDHRATGGVHRLADRLRDFVGLPGGHPDVALAVTHRDQRVEGEPPAPLHHLGHAVDGDDVFLHLGL